MQYLNKYIKKYWKMFTIAVLCLTVEAACDLLQPTMLSKIVDVGVANKNMDYVLRMSGIMLLIIGIGALAAISRNILSSNVSQKFGAEMRLDLFKKIQSLSFESLNNFEGASLVTRLTNDITQVQNFVNGLMRIFVKAPLLFIGSIIMAIHLNARMTLIIVGIIPVVSFIIYLNMHFGYPYFMKVQKMLDKVNSVMREYLAGVRVVKAFNRFDYEVSRFGKANSDFASASTLAMKVMAVFSPLITLSVNAAIILILWLGGYWVNGGSMHVGEIIAFINYMTQILFALMMITNVFLMFVRSRASLERINEVFEQKNTMETAKNAVKEFSAKGRIDFENVSFSYSKNASDMVIKDVTLKIMPGETVGIIGSTGSGKTSLVNLIPRFYDADCGTVKVDGVNVKNFDIKDLRDKIAVVPQKSLLFTGTVSDNIRWGKEDATDDEIHAAAETAEADGFIKSSPGGYDTVLGQGGVNFSGGQKQRVSIARALIKKPEILILDDCTSAVDVDTESRIRENLKRYAKDTTCIIIAQRITSVMNTDKIIVMDNGRIAGTGTHKELMKSCPIYQDIFNSQIGKAGAGYGKIQ